jgi:hypothetical protein
MAGGPRTPTAAHSFVPFAGKLAEILHPGKLLSFPEFLSSFEVVYRHDRELGETFNDFADKMNTKEKELIGRTTAECVADRTKTQCNVLHVTRCGDGGSRDGGGRSNTQQANKCLKCKRPASAQFRGGCDRHELPAATRNARCHKCGSDSRDAHPPCENGLPHVSIQVYEANLCVDCYLPLDDTTAASRCPNHEGRMSRELNMCVTVDCRLDLRFYPIVGDCPNHRTRHQDRAGVAASDTRAERLAAIAAAPKSVWFVDVGGETVLARNLRCTVCRLLRRVETVLYKVDSGTVLLYHPKEATCPTFRKRGVSRSLAAAGTTTAGTGTRGGGRPSAGTFEPCPDGCTCIGKFCTCPATAPKPVAEIPAYFRPVAAKAEDNDDGIDPSNIVSGRRPRPAASYSDMNISDGE